MSLLHEGMFAHSEIKQAAPELIVGYTHTTDEMWPRHKDGG